MRVNADEWSSNYGSSFGYRSGVPASALNYWTSGSDTEYIANGYLGGSNVVGGMYAYYMDINVVPADYLKLRNIVLGYSFPKNWCRKIGMNSVRLRMQMNNVGTWTRNKFDIDPEANMPTSGNPSRKTPRSYTMSLHVNF